MNSIRKDIFMPSSEADRFTLHQTLRGLMPEAVADTLMSHLPPTGWSDIARKADIDAQNLRFDRIDAKFDELASMKRYVVTTGIALAALICGVGAPLWLGGF